MGEDIANYCHCWSRAGICFQIHGFPNMFQLMFSTFQKNLMRFLLNYFLQFSVSIFKYLDFAAKNLMCSLIFWLYWWIWFTIASYLDSVLIGVLNPLLNSSRSLFLPSHLFGCLLFLCYHIFVLHCLPSSFTIAICGSLRFPFLHVFFSVVDDRNRNVNTCWNRILRCGLGAWINRNKNEQQW